MKRWLSRQFNSITFEEEKEMGVKGLWNILSPIKSEITLKSLKGQKLAIDLSVWICESRKIKQMQQKVLKPHLRNLYFRIQYLLLLDITPIFVLDGEIPELKWETILERRKKKMCSKKKRAREKGQWWRRPKRHFISIVRECCQLFNCLGVPYIQAEGEAEAMCAFLNQEKLVDGIITEDGDAFLYGASIIYRNFSVNGKEPHIECYRMVDIESHLNLDREGLVALGLLIGCDFCPRGVPGVGKERALKLVKSLQGENILERFKKWKVLDEVSRIEVNIRKKALECSDFPNTKVINEFLNARNVQPKKLLKWRRPKRDSMQKFALRRMEWPVKYTEGKIVPLLSHWDMRNIQDTGIVNNSLHLKVHSIVKKRVKEGIRCYEVQWHKEVNDTTSETEFYTTTEKELIFSSCYPDVVSEFERPRKKLKLE